MSVADNIARIEERIAEACTRSGRKRHEITLMAVTKFQELRAVEEAWNAGIRCFGESRVQEAAAKFDGFRALCPDMSGTELHFVGGLQRNKAKAAVSLFDCIQSVDRESLVPELAKHAAGRAEPLPVLLEFRTGEDSKSGFTDPDELFRVADLILGCSSLKVRGLMTMAPFTDDEAPVRSAFRKLAKMRRDLEQRFPGMGNWSCLSMGMSGDFEIAIEEGSTLLRIGGALFGG
ncbi:MAG: YggS family pyridoxal phosphate-dependent enzyme [Treponema sp.]|nr:YggS family pyridoxal phosphate-dependent enzyme [Treponema sp.]